MAKDIVEEFKFLEGILNTGIEFVQTYSWQILAAIIIVIIGYFVSNRIHKLVMKLGSKSKIDQTLLSFLASLARVSVLVFTLLITLNKLGITIAPLIAAVSAGIFGATFAIQAPVANYAAGLAIIIMRPFKLDEVVTIQGHCGRVEEINLAMTLLRTEDGEQVQIPNKFIMGEILLNSGDVRLVEGSIGISYDSEPDEAIEIINSLINECEDVDHERDITVGIASFGDSSIDISYRYRVKAELYHKVQFHINSEIFDAFKEANIEIPFPQRVVTMKQG